MRYDYLIVGAGACGATFARLMADVGRRCLVLDRRTHIAGNCFTENVAGVHVHRYGAHVFHTRSERIWQFANRFTVFNNFVNRPKARVGNRFYSFPVNLFTLNQLWGVCSPAEALRELEKRRVKCAVPRNLEEFALSVYGAELYELFVYGYTKKQWMCEPKDLPPSILTRISLRPTFDDRYFDTRWQGVPIDGYTTMFERILDGVDVRLSDDFFALGDWRRLARRLVFTGPIDQYFDYCFGSLQWRTLRFEQRTFKGDAQGNAIINYPSLGVEYLRSVEHKHFGASSSSGPTIVTYDYPTPWSRNQDPLYPVRDPVSVLAYKKYRAAATQQRDIVFGGRLGEYCYYDMDQAMASAMRLVEQEATAR